jgi:hypothetical protein
VLTRVAATRAKPARVAGLEIVKKQRVGSAGPYIAGPVTAVVGAPLDYRIVVTNTTARSLDVVLSDPRCDAGSLSPAATQTLLAGQSLAWECRHLVTAADGSLFSTTAFAVGTTPGGTPLGPVASSVFAVTKPA